ncbi:GAP family protein [Kitasatospora aureofaciens]|uniref:GAP family protein n=1 Tax=Kitasatospora aureofaciens TaxID=1894 RepID=UPI00380BAE2C
MGLSALGGVMLAIAGPASASTHSHPATWVGALKVALGVLLVLRASRQWHRRPADTSQAQLPEWMAAIDHLAPVKMFGLAVALAAANVKNAPLTIAAGASIVMAVLFFVLGLKLFGDGIGILTSS